jgi:hypothetical protein
MNDAGTTTGNGQPAEATAALAQLAALTASEVSSVILVVKDEGDQLEFSQLRPTPRAVPALSSVVQTAAKGYSDSELIGYSPAGVTAGRERMWIRVVDVPMLQAIADHADAANMRLFDPRKFSLAQLELATMRVTTDGVTGVFIQSLRGNQIVAQSSRVGMIVRRGIVDVPRKGDILLFSRTVDAVVVGDFAFFKDRPGFQRLFGYLQEMQQQASATFQSVTASLQIDGLEAMATVVTGSATMLGKMASIQRKLNKYPQYKAALTMPNLVKFIGEHPECGVTVRGDGAAAQLVFMNDAQHRFKILKLLDDDYLRSQLTTLDYEANSKSAPVERT